MKPNFILKNERGSVVGIAMLVMVLVTLIGLAIVNTSSVELQIAGNERVYRRVLYHADSGVSRAVASLTVSDLSGINPDPDGPHFPGALHEINIPGPNDPDLHIYFLRWIVTIAPQEIEIQSDSFSTGRPERASIVAGIRLPAPPGAITPPGNPTDYGG